MIKSIKKILNNLSTLVDAYDVYVHKYNISSCNSIWNIYFTKNNIKYTIIINSSKLYLDVSKNDNKKGTLVKYEIPESDLAEIYFLADLIYKQCKEWTESQFTNIF